MNFIENISTFQNIIYIICSILFISGIKMLGKEDTAVRGNFLSALAMFIAVAITLVNVVNPLLIIIAVGKFVIVVGWFMHLRYENKTVNRFFVGGMILALILFAIVMFERAAANYF